MPLHGIRRARRLGETQESAGELRDGRIQLHQCHEESPAENHGQNGHLDHPFLPWSKDIRSRRFVGERAEGVFRDRDIDHRWHRFRNHRPRCHRHARQRLCQGYADGFPAQRGSFPLSERRDTPCLESGDHRYPTTCHADGQLSEI